VTGIRMITGRCW